jgi:hypothetical protein
MLGGRSEGVAAEERVVGENVEEGCLFHDLVDGVLDGGCSNIGNGVKVEGYACALDTVGSE